MATYVNVFNLLSEPKPSFGIIKIYSTAIFVVMGVWALFIYKTVKDKFRIVHLRQFGTVALIAVLSLGMIIAGTLSERSQQQLLVDAISRHAIFFVDGVVSDYRPLPPGDHGFESFCVTKTCFHYSDIWYTGGFNHTASRNGPINRNGMHLRITYANARIVKLDVLSTDLRKMPYQSDPPVARDELRKLLEQ